MTPFRSFKVRRYKMVLIGSGVVALAVVGIALGLAKDFGRTETGFGRLAIPLAAVGGPVVLAMGLPRAITGLIVGELRITEAMILNPAGWFRPATAYWTDVESIRKVHRGGAEQLELNLVSNGKVFRVVPTNFHDSELIERAVLDAWASSRGGLDP